jgi:type IV secretion system protein VirB1
MREAAHAHELSDHLLDAIIRVENPRWDPLAISVNRKGKGVRQVVRSRHEAEQVVTHLWDAGVNFDVGIGQVNTINMERYRIHPVALLDPCTNVRYAARILRESIDRHGYNWKAIERYNGINPEYPWKVYRALKELRR